MSNYCLNIVQKSMQNNGITKPKLDISKILMSIGFDILNVDLLQGKKDKILKYSGFVNGILEKLVEGDVLVVQYPSDMGPLFDGRLLKRLRQKKVKTIAIIHDIDSLRYVPSMFKFYRKFAYEIKTLNEFDCVISPNAKMSSKLNQSGLTSRVVNLELFDYLTSVNVTAKQVKFSNIVSFAGNLKKSGFVYELADSKYVNYNIYGPKNESDGDLGQLYKGSYKSDELLRKINSGFSLIWDGPDKNCIDDEHIGTGSYLKYNNPYKLSFSVAAGTPVLIWKKAAESDFVLNNNIGFAINSIDEISNIFKNITEEEYMEKVANVKKIQNQVISGEFTKSAFKHALKEVQNV